MRKGFRFPHSRESAFFRDNAAGIALPHAPVKSSPTTPPVSNPAAGEIADADVIKFYSAVSGYDPVLNTNDNGCSLMDALNYWHNTGLAGHKIDAYAAIEFSKIQNVKYAIYLFGGCYVGLQLPTSAATQDIWDVSKGGAVGTWAPGSWGLHCVPVIGFDANGLKCITWGDKKTMTWAFFEKYCVEAYSVISYDFVGAKSPAGFDMATLKADLNALKET